MTFEWTDERRTEFDGLIEFMINRNDQDCTEKYGGFKSVMEEQEQYWYSDDDAWTDIQAMIKGEETLYG